ncbi:MAG TPA: hypothetical protein VML56_05290 [Burkholderiales bacterium]|nr:hypothetical protein [Burkholderiales bacterium]
MTLSQSAVALVVAALFAQPVLAQNTADTVQRNVNEQERIGKGLQSGQLTTKEAAKLEKGEANVEKMEQRAEADGKLSDAEKRRIEQAQNKESREIYREKHNAQSGNPSSASSQRMQADVQRNVNQQQRIEQGVQSGQLTNREVGNLEKGQSNVSRKEARAGANGHVGASEQQHIQAAENHQSRKIHREKHNDRER